MNSMTEFSDNQIVYELVENDEKKMIYIFYRNLKVTKLNVLNAIFCFEPN